MAARSALLLTLAILVAGCGSSAAPERRSGPPPIPRLRFSYDASAPLRYVDRGRVAGTGGVVAVHDVSFASGGLRVDGYLVLPRGSGRRAAVVVVHGSGGDRRELLGDAEALARHGLVALTITEPSTSHPPAQAPSLDAALRQIRAVQVRDVVAVRRAVDVLQSLPQVDPRRIGYLGWSAGAKNGAFVAASEPRVRALALLSAGADTLSAFVAHAPAGLRGRVRLLLGSVDPIRYVAFARPGSLLLEDGARDEVVPHAALLNVVHAAPRGTTVRWYDAPHALDRQAWEAAFAWLAGKLGR